MKDFTIDVSSIEELQTLKDIQALENIFAKAKSTIVNGETVALIRKTANTPPAKFDTITTLEELETYKQSVFKYLSP